MSNFLNLDLNILDLGVIQSEISAIISALVFVWDELVNAVNYLYDADVTLAAFVLSSVQAIGAFFHHLWDVIWGAVIVKLINAYKALHDWLAKLLGPLIRWLQRIRSWYLKHIFPIQHAILNVIQTLRVILEVFRLLGAKWAAKLDAVLQQAQTYVTDSITLILGTLNKISTILGLVVDPAMLIRTDAFSRSIFASFGTLKQAAGYGSTRPIYASEQATESNLKNAVYGPAPLETVGPDGSIVYDPAMQMVNDSLDQQIQTLGISH